MAASMVSSATLAIVVAALCFASTIHGEPSSSVSDPAFIALPSERVKDASVTAPVRVAGHFAAVESVKGWLATVLPRVGLGKKVEPAHMVATNTAPTTANAVVEDGPTPPPEAMLVGKLLQAVGSDLEGFYHHELEVGKGCIYCVEHETEYLLTSLAKKVDGFCESGSDFDKFCGFYADFRNLTVLALLSKLEVNPISVALTRCSLSEACMAPKAEADLVQAHLHQVDKISRIHFSPMEAGRKLGPQEVPSEGCAQRHLTLLVKQEVEAGLALSGSSDVSVCKECVKRGLHLYGVILVRKIQHICANPRCSKVEAWCKFGAEHQYLSKTALLLKLKPWEKVIKTCGALQFCRRPKASVPATYQMHLLPPAPIFRFDAFEWQPAPAAIPVLQILHIVHNVESSLQPEAMRPLQPEAMRRMVEQARMPKKMSFLQRLMHPWSRNVEGLGHMHKHGFRFMQQEHHTGPIAGTAYLHEDGEHEHSHRHHHAHGSHGFEQLRENGEYEHAHRHHHAHGDQEVRHLHARAMLLSGEEHGVEDHEHEAHEHGHQHGHDHMHMHRHEMNDDNDRSVSFLRFQGLPVHVAKHGFRMQGVPAHLVDEEQKDINSDATDGLSGDDKPKRKKDKREKAHKHKHEKHHDEEDIPGSQPVMRFEHDGHIVGGAHADAVGGKRIRCQKGLKHATANLLQHDSTAHTIAQGRPNSHAYALLRQASSQKVAEDSKPFEPLPAAEGEHVLLPVMAEQSAPEAENASAVKTEEVKIDWSALAAKVKKVMRVPEGLSRKVASFYGA